MLTVNQDRETALTRRHDTYLGGARGLYLIGDIGFLLRISTGTLILLSASMRKVGATAPRITAASTFVCAPVTRAAIMFADPK